MFCYEGPLILSSYKPKANKMLYLLSSRDDEGNAFDQKLYEMHNIANTLSTAIIFLSWESDG